MITVTNRELLLKTEDESREFNANKASTFYIFGPISRNTAPAIAVAAPQVTKTYGSSTILFLRFEDANGLVKEGT